MGRTDTDTARDGERDACACLRGIPYVLHGCGAGQLLSLEQYVAGQR